MKRQVSNLKYLMQLGLAFISLIGFRAEMVAQTLNANGVSHSVVATTETHGYEGAPQDFSIPVTGDYNTIRFTLKGGDGGTATNGSCESKGGEGATVSADFKIGTGTEELKVGGTIRFIVGKSGDDNGEAGGGGGGTAILYRPSNTADWIILAVAGGGGGAKQGDLGLGCIYSQKGQGGRSTEYGGNAEGAGAGAGGVDGDGGHAPSGGDFSGGGGGAYQDGDRYNSGVGTTTGGYKGYPDGGQGSRLKDNKSWYDEGHGGYGFGGGGHTDGAGGGGGGFSGGGGAQSNDNGGGGGSYVNTVYAYNDTKTAGGKGAGSNQNGYVSYQFLETGSRPQIYTQVKFAYNTDKCIDDYASHTTNGTNIQTYHCHSNANQWWYMHPTDRTIRSKLSTAKCLSTKDGSGNNGTNIHLWDCKVNDNQRFLYNGLYKTMHWQANMNKCIDAASGSATTGNVNVQLWDCSLTSNNQKWEIDGATTVSNVSNMKYIVPVRAPGFAVLSQAGSQSGSSIVLWTKDNISTNEQWYFDDLAIKMRQHQSLCIDLDHSNTSNGTNIQVWDCNNTNAQRWFYDGMTQSIRSAVNSNKCMQIMPNTNGVYGKLSNVEIHDCNGSDVQQFLIQE